MGDGKLNRAIEQGKARTTEIKTRVPELRERMPEFKERVPELGSELRAKGSELRSRGQDLARQYAKMDVSWARCGYARIAREVLLSGILGPMIGLVPAQPRGGQGGLRRPRLEPPVIFVANHSSHLDTPTSCAPSRASGATAPPSPPPPTTSTRSAGRPTASR